MKYVLCITAVCFSLISFSQGTLEFNQVRLVMASDGMQTVPAGKVWKIESVFPYAETAAYNISTSSTSVSFAGCSTGTLYYYGKYININGEFISFGLSQGGIVTPLPLWLPAGTTLCLSTSTSFSAKGYSLLEFNVIP